MGPTGVPSVRFQSICRKGVDETNLVIRATDEELAVY